jgi:hypothetical protein
MNEAHGNEILLILHVAALRTSTSPIGLRHSAAYMEEVRAAGNEAAIVQHA